MKRSRKSAGARIWIGFLTFGKTPERDFTYRNTGRKETDNEETEDLQERFDLASARIREIITEAKEGKLPEAIGEYFSNAAAFMDMLADQWVFLTEGGLDKAPVVELEKRNNALYEEVIPENYENSFLNPTYAVKTLGEELGAVLSAVRTELREAVSEMYVGDIKAVVARQELLLEMYSLFTEEETLPSYETVRLAYRQYRFDRIPERQYYIASTMSLPEVSKANRVIANADLSDTRYLYAYGENITENEKELVRFMNALPEETIATMADTFTEGYRIGFEVTGKDLSKKKLAEILYPIGFERMMRRSVANLAKLGLGTVTRVGGIATTEANRQYEFDHKDDEALYFDREYMEETLKYRKEVMESLKTEFRGYAGPAVVESFGEKNFDPVNKKEAIHKTAENNKLDVEFMTRYGMITREYIIEEERSFAIIAFPIPEITPCLPNPTSEGYSEFFREIIKVNTLDYMKYRNIQATIIAALDQADYCEVKGMNGNRTDLKINLWKLQNPEKETIFENCVADVNIPVGEVFTSPVLEGTNGTLQVSRVYLNGLEYRDLEIRFEDGMISYYNCGNFEVEKENKDFISDNVLHHHETLPIGEFAIGTNTTAYVVARKYGVEDKLPILIAEKTGPHFAVGDTCYSHTEEIKVYNPDGKEIVARENTKSRLRDTDPTAAYFNCHTDITIPYEELGELTAVRKDGSRIEILRNGRFVLPGTEELNKPLDEN